MRPERAQETALRERIAPAIRAEIDTIVANMHQKFPPPPRTRFRR